jgi:hypothetical protein
VVCGKIQEKSFNIVNRKYDHLKDRIRKENFLKKKYVNVD